jgi:peptidoglycan endopeptidase LytE
MRKINKNLITLTALTLGISFGFGVFHTDAQTKPTNENSVMYTLARENYKLITIKKGDTLFSLAKKYKTTITILKKMNNLKSDKIMIGKKFKVPTGATSDKLSLKLQKGFALEQEEPGKSILLYQKDTTYFARIEVLDSKVNMNVVKKEASEYLKATGKVHVMNSNQAHPFYKGAVFYLHASNSKVSQNLVVKKIDGKLVKFTIHFANKEQSEGITPYMIDILSTAKF